MALDYILKINGQTLEDLGLVGTRIGDAWSIPAVSRPSYPVPGSYGAVPSTTAVGASRVIPLSVALTGSTVETRRADLDTLLEHLDGLLELEWGDATGRIQWGTIDTAPIRARFESVAFVQPALEIDLDIELPHAVSWEREVQSVPITSTARRLDTLGTAPSKGTFVFPGGAAGFSSLTITYAGARGDTLESLVISGTVAAGEWLEVDCDTHRITLGDPTDESRTLKPDYYSSGGYPTFDPGDGRLGLGPQISADVDGVCWYRRAYL